MRGDAEAKCLEAVRNCIFMSSPFRNKEDVYTAPESEFLNEHYLYERPVDRFFSECRKKIESALKMFFVW